MTSGSSRDDALSFLNPSSSPPAGVGASDADAFLHDPSPLPPGSASGSFQNDGFLAASGGGDSGSSSDAEFGFARPDFGQGQLAGTVQMYERHVFLCYKNPQVWPPHVEAAEFDRLPRLLSAAVMARKGDMKSKTRLTICEGRDGIETSNGDVLIFPDMVRYRSLTHFDVDTFVEEVLVKEHEWRPGMPEALKGWQIFVCSHGSRDRRCGVCGPTLVAKFKEEIDAQNLHSQVSVSPCSHVGGHKYAGNVIIYGAHDGEVTGHWYGYVTPEDVPLLLELHVCKGQILEPLWRGQMGLSEDDQKKTQELRLRLNGELILEKASESIQSADAVNTSNKTMSDTTQCCQGNGKISCCQNTTTAPSNIETNPSSGKGSAKIVEKRILDKEYKGKSSSKAGISRKPCSMPTWFESWEREDTYAAISVVGACVSVAIAYSCFRQLG